LEGRLATDVGPEEQQPNLGGEQAACEQKCHDGDGHWLLLLLPSAKRKASGTPARLIGANAFLVNGIAESEGQRLRTVNIPLKFLIESLRRSFSAFTYAARRSTRTASGPRRMRRRRDLQHSCGLRRTPEAGPRLGNEIIIPRPNRAAGAKAARNSWSAPSLKRSPKCPANRIDSLRRTFAIGFGAQSERPILFALSAWVLGPTSLPLRPLRMRSDHCTTGSRR
jgi:hypothetical protein